MMVVVMLLPVLLLLLFQRDVTPSLFSSALASCLQRLRDARPRPITVAEADLTMMTMEEDMAEVEEEETHRK